MQPGEQISPHAEGEDGCHHFQKSDLLLCLLFLTAFTVVGPGFVFSCDGGRSSGLAGLSWPQAAVAFAASLQDVGFQHSDRVVRLASSVA